MALSTGVNPKFGVGGYPVPTGVPGGSEAKFASTAGYSPERGSNVAQTSDPMFKGFLDPDLAQDYFAVVEKTSIIQQIARKIPMGPTGVRIPHWTGNVSAKWVAEGGKKPVTKGDFNKQDVVPYKIATIFVASAEAVRANPLNYLNTMRTKIGEAIALAFDNAVINGVDSPFGKSLSDTAKTVSLADPLGAGKGPVDGSNAYTALNNGLSLLLSDNKKWTGTLFDDSAEPILNGATDAAQRPLFIDATYQDINAPFRAGRVLGRPTYLSDHVNNGTTIGYMGDFSQIIWGQVGGLSFDVSDQASLDLSVGQDGTGVTSLWQNNLVAVRVEAEFAALVNDPAAFVKLTSVVTA
jgi:HK97 family phage major capsid protein